MSTQDIINDFYSSLINKNDKWQELWSSDAVFSDAAGILNAKGREAVIQSFKPFIKTVVELKVKDRIVEGKKSCFIIGYTYINPKGEKLNQDVAEAWEVDAGRLAKLTIYFDLTTYRHFMQG